MTGTLGQTGLCYVIIGRNLQEAQFFRYWGTDCSEVDSATRLNRAHSGKYKQRKVLLCLIPGQSFLIQVEGVS